MDEMMNEGITFNKEKFKAMIHYIVDRCCSKENFGKTMLYNLAYFSDFNYYELYETKVINNVVLTETLNKISKKIKPTSQILNNIIESNIVLYLDQEDYKKAFELNQNLNNALNYNDCIIVHLMMKSQINKIISFDDDFDKIGGIKRISL